MRNYYLFFIFLSLIVITALALSFTVVGSPFKEKNRAQDTATSSLLLEARSSIEIYQEKYSSLPAALTELSSSSQYLNKIEYQKLSETEYQLCANFLEASLDTTAIYDSGTSPNFRNHEQGRQCFTITARPPKNNLPVSATPPPQAIKSLPLDISWTWADGPMDFHATKVFSSSTLIVFQFTVTDKRTAGTAMVVPLEMFVAMEGTDGISLSSEPVTWEIKPRETKIFYLAFPSNETTSLTASYHIGNLDKPVSGTLDWSKAQTANGTLTPTKGFRAY